MSRRTKGILLLTIALLLSGVWLATWLTRTETLGSEPDAERTPAAMGLDTNPARTTGTPRIGIAEGVGDRVPPTAMPADPRDTETCNASMRAGLNVLRGRLDPAASAADAAAHALLGYVLPAGTGEEGSDGDQARITRELELATQRFPDDSDLAWLRLLNCGYGCNRTAARERLLRLENRNTAAWLVAMIDAHRAGDMAGVDIALRNAAWAPHYATPDDVAFAPLRPVLSALEVDPACVRIVAASIGRPASPSLVLDLYASTVQTRSVGATVQGLVLCGDRNGALAPARRAQCERVLRRAAESEPTALGRNAALSSLLQLSPPLPDAGTYRERYRQLAWLLPSLDDSLIADDHLTHLWIEGEVDTLQETARQRGRWPPPPDWLPTDPRQRALVLGEPLPAE